jgi:hypothetical protein
VDRWAARWRPTRRGWRPLCAVLRDKIEEAVRDEGVEEEDE